MSWSRSRSARRSSSLRVCSRLMPGTATPCATGCASSPGRCWPVCPIGLPMARICCAGCIVAAWPSKPTLDALDVALLAALREHPRAGALELSRITGVARATVSARLQRLEDGGVVTGYGPDVDVARRRLRRPGLRDPGDRPGRDRRRAARPRGHPRAARGARDHRQRRRALPGGGRARTRPCSRCSSTSTARRPSSARPAWSRCPSSCRGARCRCCESAAAPGAGRARIRGEDESDAAGAGRLPAPGLPRPRRAGASRRRPRSARRQRARSTAVSASRRLRGGQRVVGVAEDARATGCAARPRRTTPRRRPRRRG